MTEKKLIQLLSKKRGFFEAILDLTESEKNLPHHEWVSALEQKKILLNCIEEVDQELLSYKERLNHLSWEIQEELEEIRRIVEKILKIDACNLKDRKKELRQFE